MENNSWKSPQRLTKSCLVLMIKEVQCATTQDTTCQLPPFLHAHLMPGIILFENEGTSGFLMTENTTGHFRGNHDGLASAAKVE